MMLRHFRRSTDRRKSDEGSTGDELSFYFGVFLGACAMIIFVPAFIIEDPRPLRARIVGYIGMFIASAVLTAFVFDAIELLADRSFQKLRSTLARNRFSLAICGLLTLSLVGVLGAVLFWVAWPHLFAVFPFGKYARLVICAALLILAMYLITGCVVVLLARIVATLVKDGNQNRADDVP